MVVPSEPLKSKPPVTHAAEIVIPTALKLPIILSPGSSQVTVSPTTLQVPAFVLTGTTEPVSAVPVTFDVILPMLNPVMV